jgi:signal transduction histidine kinase
MTPPDLLERLTAHRTIGGVPRRELEWLAAVGHERVLEPGAVLTPSTGPVRGLFVVFTGHLLIRVDRGAGPRIVMEWHGGDVTGILPYSRIKNPPGDVTAEERTEIFMVDAAHLPKLICDCPELTAVLVHVMLDRARVFKSSELLDEKLASLGRLAAGLAHELNNPASAVARSAKTLAQQVGLLNRTADDLAAAQLTPAQQQQITDLRDRLTSATVSSSPLEQADRIDAVDTWLADHDVGGIDVEPLADAGLETADLERLRASLRDVPLATVMANLSAGVAVRQLALEIDTAASRIHSLVSAVKGFTYVNQQTTLQPIAIAQGLADTVTVMRSKAKAKSIEVAVQVTEPIPPVEGYGGELNQVWANLLDNAIDAASRRVRIDAHTEHGKVIVRVVDDGSGIPADVLARIFDPFFTTKDIGQGTGLGLDIARRIVMRHRGAIDVSTAPTGTEFRVTLPAWEPTS